MLYHSLLLALIIASMPRTFTEGALHPSRSMDKEMNCEEFGKSARFNPYSVTEDDWFVFYHWGGPMTRTDFRFFYPTAKERAYITEKLENVTVPVNWTSRVVLMKNLHDKETSLLVERDRGQFWMYPFHRMTIEGLSGPVEVRLKQTSDNRYIGFMRCDTHHVYAMCRLNAIPRKQYIQDEAAKIGYRGRGGISYLYQGHHWAPIPEADEEDYWAHPEDIKRYAETLERYKNELSTKEDELDLTQPAIFPEQRDY